MTIAKTLLAKGYLPKELPPSFHSTDFAAYASTRNGRLKLETHAKRKEPTECCRYALALPSNDHRVLTIPHPSPFTRLVREVAKSFGRLLRKAGKSRFSRSRPVYATTEPRAIRARFSPMSLPGQRALPRAGASFVLRADVSQFYPALYTHAVGWAIDPKLRQRKNWRDGKLLGKRIDQWLMDSQAKISQGIPTGNDVSFLLAEIVLGQVDHELRHHADRAFRWFDDYEISCDSRQDAEIALAELRGALDKFQLRLNPKKTMILELPLATGDGWQDEVNESVRLASVGPNGMVRFFDKALELRQRHPGVLVLSYALGRLFTIPAPSEDILRVAESCITQCVLAEPGCAQKAFALLSFWNLNGAAFSRPKIVALAERVILGHEASKTSSDVAWALAFCLDNSLRLSGVAGKALSGFDDDCLIVQSLHAHSEGLLSAGFTTKRIASLLDDSTLDGPHWLALYESVRHGFVPKLRPAVRADPLFADMLSEDVSFYRTAVPQYAAIIHPGGAPSWLVRAWLAGVGNLPAAPQGDPTGTTLAALEGPVVEAIRADAGRVSGSSLPDVLSQLLAILEPIHVLDDQTPDWYMG